MYRFQVYNSIIHHLSIVLCGYHPKSSLLPSIAINFPFTTYLPPLPSGSHHTTVCVRESCLSPPFFFFFFCLIPSQMRFSQAVAELGVRPLCSLVRAVGSTRSSSSRMYAVLSWTASQDGHRMLPRPCWWGHFLVKFPAATASVKGE